MTSLLQPGSLLAARFRVSSDRRGDDLRVIDARDETSAVAQRVRVLVVETSATAAAVEGAVRRIQRYAVGVSGHAELVGAVDVEPGQVGLVYGVGDAVLLDEDDAQAGAELAAGVERALRPLHDQGMAHGALRPELVGRTSNGSVIVLGFGLCQALGRAASPSSDANVIAKLRPASLPAPEGSADAAPEVPPPLPLKAPVAAPVSPSAPPRAPVTTPRPSESAPGRSWLGPLVLGLGGVVMIAGVITAIVLARGLPPAPGASATAPAPVPPPVATALPTPLPEPSASPAPPAPPTSAAPESAGAPTPLSPPLRGSVPAAQADAPLPVDNQPAWGPAYAPVTVTLFADLECPHTRALLPGLLRLKTEHGDDVRWVFRHYPLSQHPGAERVARLLAAVGDELGPGVFWKLVSELAAAPDGDAQELVGQWLDRSNIDAARRAMLEALPAAQAHIDADRLLAAELFVRATPALFVNGKRLEGFQPAPALEAAVQRERSAGLFSLLAGTPPDDVYVRRAERNLLNLGDEPPERACLSDHGAPARGPAEAPVRIVHFCAYESSYCQQMEPTLAQLVARHPRDVRVIWRSFPLAPEGDGRTAANFALAVRKAGGDKAFWMVHRALLDAHAAVEAPALAKLVKELGMDAEVLLSAARSREHDAGVKADMELGRKLSVSGVPTTFVNGRRKDGLLTAAELEALVAEELALAKRLATVGRGSISAIACAAHGQR